MLKLSVGFVVYDFGGNIVQDQYNKQSNGAGLVWNVRLRVLKHLQLRVSGLGLRGASSLSVFGLHVRVLGSTFQGQGLR